MLKDLDEFPLLAYYDLSQHKAFSNPHPRQAWDLFSRASVGFDSHSPLKRFLGCGLLKF